MFGSATLEVMIGIVLVFVLFSTICTAIREGIEAWLKTRAAYLELGILQLLKDKDGSGSRLALNFYNHPLIYTLFSGEYSPRPAKEKPPILAKGHNLPSYIPAANFAVALMDLAGRGPDPQQMTSERNGPVISLDSIRSNLEHLGNPAVQRVLQAAIDTAEGDLKKVQANLEAWYNAAMDRVSGWYKRSTQWILFWIGLFVAIGLNINTITIADYLYRNDAARAALVAQAGTAATDIGYLERTYEDVQKELDAMDLPIGWSHGWGTPRPGTDLDSSGAWNIYFVPVLGWLLTALAATVGAPFWFDVLNKFMVIRSTVKPHEKSPEEASEDRQLPR